MREETKVLLGRTFDFGIRTLKVLRTFTKRFDYDVIRRQLAKSATSIGSNYEEAQAAESKKDFIHKIGIVLLEVTELQKIFSAIKLPAQKK